MSSYTQCAIRLRCVSWSWMPALQACREHVVQFRPYGDTGRLRGTLFSFVPRLSLQAKVQSAQAALAPLYVLAKKVTFRVKHAAVLVVAVRLYLFVRLTIRQCAYRTERGLERRRAVARRNGKCEGVDLFTFSKAAVVTWYRQQRRASLLRKSLDFYGHPICFFDVIHRYATVAVLSPVASYPLSVYACILS